MSVFLSQSSEIIFQICYPAPLFQNELFCSDGTIPKFTSIPIPIKCSISIPILDSDSRFQ